VIYANDRERERENSIFFRGYRYALRDQDTTWLAAYESMRRGDDETGLIYRGGCKYGLKGYAAR
jgi:hypothetical protein